MPRGIPKKGRRAPRAKKEVITLQMLAEGQNSIFSRLTAIELAMGRLPLEVASLITRRDAPKGALTVTPMDMARSPGGFTDKDRRDAVAGKVPGADPDGLGDCAEFPLPPGWRTVAIRDPKDLVAFLNSLIRR